MGRFVIWIVLALLWAAIAVAGAWHHHLGNAALEAAVAVLFLITGLTVRRRDSAAAERRHTASRPR